MILAFLLFLFEARGGEWGHADARIHICPFVSLVAKEYVVDWTEEAWAWREVFPSSITSEYLI